MRTRSRVPANMGWTVRRMLMTGTMVLAPAFAVLAAGGSQLGGEFAEPSCARFDFPPLRASMLAMGFLLSPGDARHGVAYITSLEVRK